jgi:hypothetical protein
VKEAALIAGLLSGICGLLSTLALMKGSIPVPWGIQTWDNETLPEMEHRRVAQRWNRIGLTGLFIAFALSAVAAVASYLS